MVYWEYIIKYQDPFDNIEEERSGVVTGEIISEAMKEMEEYYGQNNIVDIISFRYIAEDLIDFKNIDEKSREFLKEQIEKC